MEAALATSSLALYGVTVSVELARRSSVKGDGFDRLVFGIGNSGKDLHDFIFREINSHGERPNAHSPIRAGAAKASTKNRYTNKKAPPPKRPII